MTVLFRCDASGLIGSGHVMRCLTLADELKLAGEPCVFVSRTILSGLAERIRTSGHALVVLHPAQSLNDGLMSHAGWLAASWQDDAEATTHVACDCNAGWIVVDHYALDALWEKRVEDGAGRVAVIDDLADRDHACALLLDQNLHIEPHARYALRVPESCQLLMGPRYALLRPEFSDWDNRKRAFGLESVCYLVAFSGTDGARLTVLALDVLAQACRGGDRVHVVVNRQNEELSDIQHRCLAMGWLLHVNVRNIAALMIGSDIAIGAGGGMLWERAALGLPSIAISRAENQREQVVQATRRGLVLGGSVETIDNEALHAMVLRLRDNPVLRRQMSGACCAAVDGRGAKRVASRMVLRDIKLRIAEMADSADIFSWRNHERIRRVSRHSDLISVDDHERWFSTILANRARHLLVASDGDGPLGIVRFDNEHTASEVSIYLVPLRLGIGLGASLLLAAEGWLASNCPEIVEIKAEVHAGNLASEELFRSCGYRFDRNIFVKRLETRA